MSAPSTGRRPTVRGADPVLVVLWVVLVAVAIVWVLPLVFIVFTSLKSDAAIYGGSVFAPPLHPAWSNYGRAWTRGNFDRTLLNSAIITAIKLPVGIVVSAGVAYVLAATRMRFRNAVFVVLLCGTMIPFQVLLAPLFTLVNGLGLLNSYVGVILPYVAFGLPYQVFVLRNFFRQVPRELGEAARIDGASHLALFFRIYLPLSLPALAALVILDFVATWNEFAMALVILQDQARWTLPLGLMSFQGQFSSAYGPLNAAIVMTVVPAVLAYLIFQRYFVTGLMAGAVKE